MADVFISYKREDHAKVSRIAACLSQLEVSVWYYGNLHAGEEFSEVIEAEIAKAIAVVTCWTELAAKSRWVRAESRIALDGRINPSTSQREPFLFPVLLEECRPPLPFNEVHTVNLANWDGEASSDAFCELVSSIAVKLRRAGMIEWIEISKRPTIEALQGWISKYPDDPLTDKAARLLEQLRIRRTHDRGFATEFQSETSDLSVCVHHPYDDEYLPYLRTLLF